MSYLWFPLLANEGNGQLTVQHRTPVLPRHILVLAIVAQHLETLARVIKQQRQTAIVRVGRRADPRPERLRLGGRIVQTGNEMILLADERVQRLGGQTDFLRESAQKLEDDPVARVEEPDQIRPHGLRVGVGQPLIGLLSVVIAIHAEELLQVRRLGIVGQLLRVGVPLAGATALVELAENLHLLLQRLGEEAPGMREEFVHSDLVHPRVLQICEANVPKGREQSTALIDGDGSAVARGILFAEGCIIDDGQVDGIVVNHGARFDSGTVEQLRRFFSGTRMISTEFI